MVDPIEPIERTKNYTLEEIRSHSSVLTNLRLDLVFSLIDRRKLDAWDNPILDNVKKYFSALYTAYDNVWPVLSKEENEELTGLFKNYFTLFFGLKKESTRTLSTSYQMIGILDFINRFIKGSLQKRSYFFKLGTPDVKGIEASYKVIKEGGGLFGFKPTNVQGLVEEQHPAT